MLKVLYSVRAHQPYERYRLKSGNVIQFCLVDRVVIPIAVRSKEWRYLKRSVSSVFAAACQMKLAKRRCPQSSTAMGDNALFPEATFSL